ncbi:hypothetical protein [Cellulosimicrobium protaetiae]
MTEEEERALSALRNAVERAKRTSVALPVQLVRNRTDDGDAPLARLLRGDPGKAGRGGAVRLKLYLTLVMRATAKPHHLDGRPAYHYATLLGLPDPMGSGRRRIAQALAWLDEEGFITLAGRGRGSLPDIKVRRVYKTRGYEGPPFVRVPSEMWKNGWIVRLSGRALALWIVLKELTGSKKAPNGAWATGDHKDQYGLSADTWTRATQELVDAGLLEVETVIERRDFGQERRRKKYRLIEDALTRNAFLGQASTERTD